MKTFKKLVVVLMVGALLGLGVLGCSTVKGAGRDIQSVGKGVERASDGAAKK